MARDMIRKEGILIGGSSGTAMSCAIDYIRKHKIGKDKTCVVMCPDGVRNYMTKFLNADWMNEYGFMTEEEVLAKNTCSLVPNNDWGQDKKVKDLKFNDNMINLQIDSTCGDAEKIMRENN